MTNKFVQNNFKVAISVFLVLVVGSGVAYFLFSYLKTKKAEINEIPIARGGQRFEKIFQAMFEPQNLSQAEKEILINSQPKELREKIEKIIQLEKTLNAASERNKQKINDEIISFKKEVITLLEKEKPISKNKIIDFTTGPEGYVENTAILPLESQSSQNLPPGSVVNESSLIEGGEENLSPPNRNEMQQIPPLPKDYVPNFPN